jgi:hypothetical protein
LMLRFIPQRKIGLATLALGVASLAVSVVLVSVWPRSAFFHLPARGWELLVGALLAMNVSPRIANRRLAEVLSATGLALMVAPVFFYSQETAFPGVAAIPPVLGCAFVICANENVGTTIKRALSWQPIVFLGLISYSLYLWHWPILAFTRFALVRPLQPFEAFVCVLAAFSISIVSWRYVEQPFRKRLGVPRRSLMDLKLLSIPTLTRSGYAALALTAILIATGSFFQETRGAPWRFGPEVRVLAEKHVRKIFEFCIAQDRSRRGLMVCQFGDRTTDLILWGDSHAQHYLPAVLKTFGRGRAYITAGCMPIPAVRSVSSSGQMHATVCPKNNDYVMGEILRLKPKIVVMASRWTQVDGVPDRFLVDTSAVATREGSRQTFVRAIESTTRTLTEAGIKVILMGQVPEMKRMLYTCLALSKTLGLRNCEESVPRQEAEQMQSFTNAALAATAASNPDIFFFQPFPHVCDNSRCYGVKDNTLLYFDRDHLNVDGGLAFAEPLSQDLPESFRLPPSQVIQAASHAS